MALFLLASDIAVLDPLRADSLLGSLWEGLFGRRSFWPGFFEDPGRSRPLWNQ